MSLKKEPDAVACVDFEGFATWLRQHRGIGERTIQDRLRKVSRLTADLGNDPTRYDAALIRKVLLSHFATVSPSYAKVLALTLRMYLRFLVSRSECSPLLIGAIPKAAGWRLAELPRYLPLEDVERVIAACDVKRPAGLRDRAILLLLVRLALRAGDVYHLRLADIDWRNARLQVCGKSRRSEWLPLPQDVGEALLDYIERGRARVDEEQVFLRAIPPYRPFPSARRISGIVLEALQRAGVQSPAGRGAHLIRHSVATGLLRSGASLESIGALLRHRTFEATAIYAKVDLPMLQEVMQPWIGDVR